MISPQELDIVVKLLAAAVLGGLVGFEREHDKRPAGLRTHMLVCVGATVFGLIPIYYFNNSAAEVSRVWQNILTGIGFLGAGAVIKEERSVHGLTTAAGIWAIAAVGLAIAAGMFFLAAVAELIILLTLFVFRRMEQHMSPIPPDQSPRQ